MILSIPFVACVLLVSHGYLIANIDENQIAALQKEVADLASLQATFNEQKNGIQEELARAMGQLEETGKQQAQLDMDIKQCNQLIIQLSGINQQLYDDNQQLLVFIQELRQQNIADQKTIGILQEQLDDLLKNEFQLKEKKESLEAIITDLQEQLEQAHAKEKELYRKKLETKTQSAIEIHRLNRTLLTLQEEVDDTSWSNALQKHYFKMIMCCAAGALTTYAFDHGLLRTA